MRFKGSEASKATKPSERSRSHVAARWASSPGTVNCHASSVRVTTTLTGAPATLSVQRAETPGFKSSVRALMTQRSMSSASAPRSSRTAYLPRGAGSSG